MLQTVIRLLVDTLWLQKNSPIDIPKAMMIIPKHENSAQKTSKLDKV